MPSVTVRDWEPIEKAIRRFKKVVDRSGILNDLRDREFYEKPSTLRKRARNAAIKRQERLTLEGSLEFQLNKRHLKKKKEDKKPADTSGIWAIFDDLKREEGGVRRGR